MSIERKSSNILQYFREYCNSSSIHGCKYFGENRTIFERIWWIVTFIICLTVCTIMIYNIYSKYDQSPIIVTFATKETSINKIPFPAITICPEVKTVRNLCNFTEIYLKKTEKLQTTTLDDKYYEYVSFLCDDYDVNLQYLNHTTLDFDFFATIDKIKPNFDDLFNNCRFMGVNYPCKHLLIPIITDEGVCYSFNMQDRNEIFSDIVSHYNNYHKTEISSTWNIEKGYYNDITDVYPKRALLAGATNGFVVHLATEIDNIDNICKEVQGYRVLLHSPVRLPRLRQEFVRVPLDETVIIAVQPVMITTSDAVKSYPKRKRDCCFPFERKLKFFKSYSQLNCQLECLTNLTLQLCDCVNFYMPREKSTKICGPGSYQCMEMAETRFSLDRIFIESKSYQNYDCDCMPLCTDLSYYGATSQTFWNWNGSKFGVSRHNNKRRLHLSKLTVYFKFDHFITSERSELYGPLDFLANFGGLLGLFTGFSILSLMEIIYYLTVRIYCNFRLYGKWSGDSQ